MKKSLKTIFLLVFSLVLLCAALSGCAQKAYIVDVLTHTTADGTVITYVYSDGSETNYTVRNGTDGKDGAVSIDEIYEKWLAANGKEDTAANYNDFLSEYLTLSTDLDYSQTIQKTLLSAATVYCDYVTSSRTSSSPWQQPTTVYSTVIQSGSAFIWKIESDYTYLVTNYHVVYCSGAATAITGGDLPMNIYCYLYGSIGSYSANGTNETYGYTEYDYGDYAVKCTYVGGSIAADIAVVKAPTEQLKAVNPEIEEVTLAEEYYTGQTVYTVGNPLGYGFSVTQGVVSVDDEYIDLSIDGTSRSYRSIRTDTAIYSGNSGGGLFNAAGELIGITNASATSYESLNYAIPLEIMRGAVENILDNDGALLKPTLGVVLEAKNTKYVYSASLGYGKICEDVVVNLVTGGSIAETMGLKAGDYITGIAIGETQYAVTRSFNISDLLFVLRAGDEIKIFYTRDGVSAESGSYTMQASDFSLVK